MSAVRGRHWWRRWHAKIDSKMLLETHAQSRIEMCAMRAPYSALVICYCNQRAEPNEGVCYSCTVLCDGLKERIGYNEGRKDRAACVLFGVRFNVWFYYSL